MVEWKKDALRSAEVFDPDASKRQQRDVFEAFDVEDGPRAVANFDRVTGGERRTRFLQGALPRDRAETATFRG